MNKKVGILVWMLSLSNVIFGSSLSTTIPELVFDNVVPGKPCSLNRTEGAKFSINNTGSDKINVQVELQDPITIKAGYEPILDMAWITLEKSYFEGVIPNNNIHSDVTVSLPQNYLYIGKKFQATLWSHTTAIPGKVGVGVGLNTRILVNVIKYDGLPAESRENRPAVTVIPDKLVVDTVSETKKQVKFKLVNSADETQRFIVSVDTATFNAGLVTIDNFDVQLSSGQTSEIGLNISIPKTNPGKRSCTLKITCLTKNKYGDIAYPVTINVTPQPVKPKPLPKQKRIKK
jgi:hypothetical protein